MVDGDEFIAQRLREAFHGWKIWQTDGPSLGRPRNWYANRDHVLTGAEMIAGLRHTVAADTPLELRTLLERQAELEQQVEVAKRRMQPRGESPAWNSAYL